MHCPTKLITSQILAIKQNISTLQAGPIKNNNCFNDEFAFETATRFFMGNLCEDTGGTRDYFAGIVLAIVSRHDFSCWTEKSSA